MKIIFFSNYSELYGANKVLLDTVLFLQSSGNEIKVVIPRRGPIEKFFISNNVKYIVIHSFPAFLYFKKSIKFLLLPILIIFNFVIFPFLLLKTYFFKPDLIYSNTSAENFGIFIAKILRVKHIWHIHEFMSIDHGAYFYFGEKMKKKLISQSDGIIFVSNAVAQFLTSSMNLQNNQIVLYNSLNYSVKKLENKKVTNKLNIGIVGILDVGKGQHIAIKYFYEIVLKKYPDAMLHIYGNKESSYKKRLINIIHSLSIEDKVIFQGFEPNKENIYKSIDILLVFSRYEGFGLVTIEAMLYGIPVLGFNSGATKELIVNRVTGCLFNDEKTFSEELDYLLKETNYETIRINSFNYVKSNFMSTTYNNKIDRFIKKIMSND